MPSDVVVVIFRTVRTERTEETEETETAADSKRSGALREATSLGGDFS